MSLKKIILLLNFIILIGILIHVPNAYFWTTYFFKDEIDLSFYNDKLEFPHLNYAYNIGNCHRNISLVLIVLCQISDKSVRETIRNTWGQWISKDYSSHIPHNFTRVNYHSSKLRLLFVVGSKAMKRDEIIFEVKYFQDEFHLNDILFLPGLTDTYYNLTLKTLAGLSAAHHICSNATYFLKADTDVFINIPHLIHFLNGHAPNVNTKSYIFGNKQSKALVIRDKNSKWYVSEQMYSKRLFPDYVTGSGYVLNEIAVREVLRQASLTDRLFVWEDVAVSGIYSANATIVDSKLFRYEDMSNIEPCTMMSIIIAHRISLSKMASLWNAISDGERSCNRSSSFKTFKNMIKEMV